ncbi:hypothetical protein AURDEDRAFT_165011 [Auricularia subglabra TFB-10046 SS5]|nr:hypothetical protein AURDEDRAFT_165011 [Auricularia subglabra TFB-10046 SS5]
MGLVSFARPAQAPTWHVKVKRKQRKLRIVPIRYVFAAPRRSGCNGHLVCPPLCLRAVRAHSEAIVTATLLSARPVPSQRFTVTAWDTVALRCRFRRRLLSAAERFSTCCSFPFALSAIPRNTVEHFTAAGYRRFTVVHRVGRTPNSKRLPSWTLYDARLDVRAALDAVRLRSGKENFYPEAHCAGCVALACGILRSRRSDSTPPPLPRRWPQRDFDQLFGVAAWSSTPPESRSSARRRRTRLHKEPRPSGLLLTKARGPATRLASPLPSRAPPASAAGALSTPSLLTAPAIRTTPSDVFIRPHSAHSDPDAKDTLRAENVASTDSEHIHATLSTGAIIPDFAVPPYSAHATCALCAVEVNGMTADNVSRPTNEAMPARFVSYAELRRSVSDGPNGSHTVRSWLSTALGTTTTPSNPMTQLDTLIANPQPARKTYTKAPGSAIAGCCVRHRHFRVTGKCRGVQANSRSIRALCTAQGNGMIADSVPTDQRGVSRSPNRSHTAHIK